MTAKYFVGFPDSMLAAPLVSCIMTNMKETIYTVAYKTLAFPERSFISETHANNHATAVYWDKGSIREVIAQEVSKDVYDSVARHGAYGKKEGK